MGKQSELKIKNEKLEKQNKIKKKELDDLESENLILKEKMEDTNKNIHEMMTELKLDEDVATTDVDEHASQRTYTGSSNMAEAMGGKTGIKSDWAGKVD
jgi:5'-3' exonuclease